MASEEVNKPRSRLWILVLGIILLVLLIPAAIVYYRAKDLDDWTRDWVVRSLSERFSSRVELGSIHVSAFPEMSVTGENLAIYYHNRTDVPPMIRIPQFTFHLGFMGVLRVPRHIRGVHLDEMVITIPPRGQPAGDTQPPLPPTKIKKPLPKIVIDQVVCDETTLLILPKQAGKEPLDFDIHDLVLSSVGAGRPFSFRGNLRNAKPVGEIRTRGKFGPWQIDDPGSTPVTGDYTFTDADLDPFPGIAGKLSSTGNYSGVLGSIDVQGKTDTPAFSLDPVGRPVPLHTEFSATVDGTNGDTYLHPVNATLIRSQITANGRVVRVPEKQGHLIVLDIIAPKARLEDLLQLATKSNQPMMTGVVNLKTKMVLPPGKVKVLDKLTLDGEFDVSDARFASSDVRDKLASFSRHAQGEPDNPDAGSAISGLKGKFHLKNGVIKFDSLTFSVPGAVIQLDGTYKLRGEDLDFTGELRMEAKLSQLVTGKKSFFLKAVDPFFSKQGAGTLIPITISGTRDNPTLEFSIFHRTMRKTFGGDKNDTGKENKTEEKKKEPGETRTSPR
jgi:AsmA-like C-terminal region